MILANITSYIGQIDAEHYYCSYIIENTTEFPKKTYSGSSYLRNELTRVIKEKEEAYYLNRKESCTRFHTGSVLKKFNTINQIHETLIETFPNQDIVTYYEDQLFRDMLYIKDGVNLGIKAFGEVFTYVPTSCYKDLLPSPELIKIKCDDCGKEYTLDEVTYESEHLGRPLIIFIKKRDMDDICCKYFNLIWNVVL